MTPRAEKRWAALLCLVTGVWLVYVIWSRQPGLRVPSGIAYLAAASFIAAGISLSLQGREMNRAAALPAILAAAAMAGIGGWIGFGPGSRRCGGSFGGLDFVPAEWSCRLVFGAGAILTAGIVLLMLRSLFSPSPPQPETQ